MLQANLMPMQQFLLLEIEIFASGQMRRSQRRASSSINIHEIEFLKFATKNLFQVEL
jgi:hypothetical protein